MAAIGLGVTPLAVDDTGVPHLLRGNGVVPRISAADATTAARMYVARLAPAWGVRAAAAPTLESLGEVPVLGGTIVRFRQVIDGLPVDPSSGGELHVMVDKGGALIAASGKLFPADMPHPQAASLAHGDDDAGAIARAVSDLYQVPFAPAALAMTSSSADGGAARGAARGADGGADGVRRLAGRSGQVQVSLSRARKAWYPDGRTLTPAWIVEAYSSNAKATGGDAYRTVIAADGRVLARVNLEADARFSYRVFAETTGEFHPLDGPLADVTPNATGMPNTTPYPPYVTPSLVTVDGLNHPAEQAGPDPWLAPGSTETNGNNVDAYTDMNPPDGLTPSRDFRATVTSAQAGAAPGVFDRTYDTSAGALASQTQEMAGITSLFYLINWLHDFWYDAGFTEAAGNAQRSNLNRGGEGNDPLLAEAQDSALGPGGGAHNNANMATPADGMSPRMQVYLWDGKSDRSLTISKSNRTPPTGPASFGPLTFTTTGPVALANDGSTAAPMPDGPAGTTSDACQPLTAAATGAIVLADRGTCSFKTKVLNAQNAGALGVILADNAAAAEPPRLGDDPTITDPITIGAVSVLEADGDEIKAGLAAAGADPVSATMHRGPAGPDLDGTLDATVVSHEFGHYLHHRLSVCNTPLCAAMSEGWADFDALLVTSRAGDDFTGAFPIAVYSTQSFPADPVYYGIRRAPYSVNQAINPLSFRHMANGERLPPPPFIAGPTFINAESHNAGEVWASMLWEGYAALQLQPRAVFEDVRRRMQQYVVASLLLAPPDSTPTEMRDAILAAAYAASPTDHDILAAAYARRGFGSCAVSPDRNSTDFAGITESSEVRGRFVPGAVAMQKTRSCGGDQVSGQVLDPGEAARISVPISNPGPAALSHVAVTLSSDTADVHIANPTAVVGTLGAYGHTTATFDVALDASVTTATPGSFHVRITGDNACEATVDTAFVMPLDAEDRPASSATDTFDAVGSVWTPAAGTVAWTHARRTGLDGLWAGADAAATSDASLVSPPLTAGDGPVSVTFEHRFSFEFTAAAGTSPLQAYDGGVIEYSTDGGSTWQDVSTIATPGYNQTLVGGTSSNPLAGRRAYGAESPGYSSGTTRVTLDFGTHLSGTTFQLRFRIGTDAAKGAPGWEIDNVVFTGLVDTPFPTLVASTNTCDAGPGSGPEAADQGGCCQTGGAATGSAGLALGVLVVLLRRRRREP